jgi:hypothetical protein
MLHLCGYFSYNNDKYACSSRDFATVFDVDVIFMIISAKVFDIGDYIKNVV